MSSPNKQGELTERPIVSNEIVLNNEAIRGVNLANTLQ